jgi:hypothetical protein
MNIKIKPIITLFFLFLVTSFSASAQDIDSRLKTQYLYTINNISSIEQVTSIQAEIETMKFVEKVKLNVKDESSGKAQLIIFVNEPSRTSEGQIMFEATSLKQVIFKDGIDLLDLKISKY